MFNIFGTFSYFLSVSLSLCPHSQSVKLNLSVSKRISPLYVSWFSFCPSSGFFIIRCSFFSICFMILYFFFSLFRPFLVQKVEEEQPLVCFGAIHVEPL